MTAATGARMQAVRLFEFGAPEVLQLVEVDVPAIGPDEVLVRVRATSVNSFDLAFRGGRLPSVPGRKPFSVPFQLGREAAGEVVEVGQDVSRFKVGDRVVQMTCPACGHCEMCRAGSSHLCISIDVPGHTRFGGYAQFVAVHQDRLWAAPDNVSFEQLACSMWSYGTILHGLDRAGIRPNQDILITAASSGMGTAALQIVRAFGARRVFGTTGSANKADELRELGYDEVFNYRDEDVVTRIREATGGRGVDLVLDNVGGPMVPLGIDSVRMGGSIVCYAQMGGETAQVDLNKVIVREISIIGTRASRRSDQALCLDLLRQGRIAPVIAAVLPLSKAAQAHELLESQQLVGRVVLVPEH